MPVVESGDARIYYEESGAGFPILLLAPGFMYSRIDAWKRVQETFPDYRFNPLVEFPSDFKMVAMDQRNARGQSVAPVKPTDDWKTFAEDQIAVVNDAGFEQFHVWGGCIGVPFALELCRHIPERIVSLVLQDPIGVCPQAPLASVELFDKYAEDITSDRPDLDIEDVKKFGRNLYAKDFEKEFGFSVTREFVREQQVPMLIMPGFDDEYHPTVTAEEIHANAPNSEIDRDWMERTPRQNRDRIGDFLHKYTPAGH